MLVDLRPVLRLLKGGATAQHESLAALRRSGFDLAFGDSAAQALLSLRFQGQHWSECPLQALKLLVWIGEKTARDAIRIRTFAQEVEAWIRVLQRLGVTNLRELFEIPERQMNRRFGSLRDRVFDSIHAVWDQTLRLLPEPEQTCKQVSLHHPETGLYPSDVADLLLHLDPLGIWLEGYLAARGAGVLSFDLELHFEVISKSLPTSRKLEIRLGRPIQKWIQLKRVFEERLRGDVARHPWPSSVISAAFRLLKKEAVSDEQVAFVGDGMLSIHHRVEEEWFELFRQRAGQDALRVFRKRGRHLPEERLECIPWGGANVSLVSEWELELMDLFHFCFLEETFRFFDPKVFELKAVARLIPLERLQTRWWTGQEVARDYYKAIQQDGTEVSLFSEAGVWYQSGSYD